MELIEGAVGLELLQSLIHLGLELGVLLGGDHGEKVSGSNRLQVQAAFSDLLILRHDVVGDGLIVNHRVGIAGDHVEKGIPCTVESCDFGVLNFLSEGESCDEAQTKAIGRAIEQRDNVKECVFISKEEAIESFEERYEGDELFQNLDPEILRDRYAVFVYDLNDAGKTAQDLLDNVPGVAKVRVDEDISGGLITLRNVAGVVCIALIAILLLVSVFIISNTIKLTTFDRRDEIAIMKMVGATNGFIRWPFVYEGFMIGLLSAVLGFGLQWLLYESVAKSLAMSDRLQLLTIVDFTTIWQPVAAIFAAAGILIGVGGSLTAIRKFLHV